MNVIFTCGGTGGHINPAIAVANAWKELYQKQVLPAVKKGLSADVYTQVSDVEDEINGLLTYDRQETKLDESTAATMARTLQTAFQSAFEGGTR